MMDLRNVIVPLDGSSLAEHSVPIAATLASAAGAWLRLVAISDEGVGFRYDALPAGLSGIEARRREQTAAYLARIASRVHATHGIRVTAETRTGSPVDGILSAVREYEADLIVISSHGYGGIKRLLLGSVTDKVVRRSDVPVLVVRAEHTDADFGGTWRIDSMILALDQSASSEEAIEPAMQIARLQHAAITPIAVITQHHEPRMSALPEADHAEHAATLPDRHEAAVDYLNGVAARLRAAGLAADPVVVDDERIARAIIEHARGGTDLIVVASHGRGGVCRAVLGSVADRIAREASTPVLIVPAGHEEAMARREAAEELTAAE